ncbi:hypothetical protein [Amycolatopsis sp. cg9]|uniref:hypothetical protein n=1 Tax=Amycolatopsis sp. cg9 TaxID=3238801 RepID=UPI0035253873
MTSLQHRRDPGPARAGGFPEGLRVGVRGGRFDGRRGVVVDRAPDLRPGSVWVEFTGEPPRLVPGYRLDVTELADDRP